MLVRVKNGQVENSTREFKSYYTASSDQYVVYLFKNIILHRYT